MTMVETLNAFAARWADFMVRGLCDATLLLLVVTLLWLLLRRWASAQVGYCLFLLVILKLLLPISVTVPAWMAKLSPAQVAAQLPGMSMARSADKDAAAAGRSSRVTDADSLASIRQQGARARTTADAVPAGFSLAAKLMLAWAAIVLVLFARFGWVQWRTGRQFRRANRLDPKSLAVDAKSLARRVGVRGPLRLSASPAVTSPILWRVVRPQLVLPEDFDRNLTSRQIAWLLLHEFAHVRRRDLWVAALQRLVQIVHFFNPAVWLANWMVDRQREYACDDVALAACECSRCDCGRAFLWAVERANGMPASAAGTLGFFAYRSFAKRRLLRILDSRRAIRPRLSAAAAALLLMAACLALPRLRANEGQPPATTSVVPRSIAGSSVTAPGPSTMTRGWLDFSFYGVFRFLEDKEVASELRLSPEQMRKLVTMRKEFSIRDSRRPNFYLTPLKFTAEQQDKLAAVFTPEQLERLRQIRIQAAGAAALENTEIAKAIGISDKQRREMEKIKQSADEEIGNLVGKFLSGARSPQEKERTFQQKTAIEKETPKRILNMLSAEQKSAFEKMQGKTTQIDLSRFALEQ